MAFAKRIVPKTLHIIVGVTCGIAASGTLGLQTLGLSYYKKVLALYKDGQMVQTPRSLEELKEQVCFDINLDPALEVDLELFMAAGHHTVHKGSTNLRTGAIIGFPANFAYNSSSDVEKDQIHVSGQHVDFDSENGQQLLDSMILSTDAKRFAIGREVNYCKQHHVFVIALMQGLSGVGAYTNGAFFNNTFQLKVRLKMWARLIMYGVIAGVWGFGYIMMKDAYSCYRDRKTDEKTAYIGYSYAVGGVEYYDKMLQRNKAIRQLMGSEGEVLYTVYGNQSQGWRENYVQITERRDAMKSKMEGYESGEIKAKRPRDPTERDKRFYKRPPPYKLPSLDKEEKE